MKITSRPGRFLLSLLLLALSLAATAAERTVYFVNDAQGSPVAAMDQQGEVLWRESYAPYGERRTKAADNNGKPAYTGKPEDADTSLVYMHARMYDPETARFTGIDPQGYRDDSPQSFGRYLYGNNAPYVYVDPNGEHPVLIPILIFVAREAASAQLESATGVPLPTVKNAVKGSAKLIERNGPVVVGETMERVLQTAIKTPGSKILDDMPNFKEVFKERYKVESAMMQYNRKWILDQLRSGRTILDIGRDPDRKIPSIFYAMEQKMISNYKKLHADWDRHVRQ